MKYSLSLPEMTTRPKEELSAEGAQADNRANVRRIIDEGD
jgi:hypothetical protein